MQIKSNMEFVKQHNLKTGTSLSIFKMSSDDESLEMLLLMCYHVTEDLLLSIVDISMYISFL